MFFHLASPTQWLSSCSSVDCSFRKFPFKSLKKKKKKKYLWTDLIWQAVFGNMQSFNSLQHPTYVQVSWRERIFVCPEQEINSTLYQYDLFPRLSIDCITSLEISFNFFFLTSTVGSYLLLKPLEGKWAVGRKFSRHLNSCSFLVGHSNKYSFTCLQNSVSHFEG